MIGSVLRGSLGFGAVSVAAFSVWAFAGRWLTARLGEAGEFAAVFLVFLPLSVFVLHRLVKGPRPMLRFAVSFFPAFTAYAVAWSACWFQLHSRSGAWLGTLVGTFAFALVAGSILGGLRALPSGSAVLFVTHWAGYVAGDAVYAGLGGSTAGKLGWGLCYGLGFGAGLGYAFHAFQQPREEARP